MDNIPALLTLAENPPQPQEGTISHDTIGPIDPAFDENHNWTVSPYVDMLTINGTPFIVHTSKEGQNVSIVWDGPNTTPRLVEGWVEDEPQPDLTYISCRWYTPSEYELNSNRIVTLPDDYPYSRALPELQRCNNPEMGFACSAKYCQTSCVGYEPDTIKVPVSIRLTHRETQVAQEFSVQTARLNNGIRVIQVTNKLGDEEPVVLNTTIGSRDDLNTAIKEVKILAEEAGAESEIEELFHQPPRNSFLKGLIPT